MSEIINDENFWRISMGQHFTEAYYESERTHGNTAPSR